jgi:thioredoxin reductase (NADPH)
VSSPPEGYTPSGDPIARAATTRVYDCAVIGAGPAGLTAALYLTRFRRSVLIADGGRSRAALIPRSHNFPGATAGLKGGDLLAQLRQQVDRYGPADWVGAALGLEAAGQSLWRVRCASGEAIARTVILATGVVDRRPPIPGAEAAIEAGLLRFCPICDGFEAMLDRIAVIGDDDHAAREALFLRTYSPCVTLLNLRASKTLSASLRAELQAAGVSVLTVDPTSLRVADRKLAVRQDNGTEILPFDVVYGALGVDPQNQLAAGLGLVAGAAGCIAVDDHQQTAVATVYAAGDVVRGLDQISVAFGEAAIAATAIHNRLPKIILGGQDGGDVR